MPRISLTEAYLPSSSIIIAHFLSGLEPIQMLRRLGRSHHSLIGTWRKRSIMNDCTVIILKLVHLFKYILLLSCSSYICTFDQIALAVRPASGGDSLLGVFIFSLLCFWRSLGAEHFILILD